MKRPWMVMHFVPRFDASGQPVKVDGGSLFVRRFFTRRAAEREAERLNRGRGVDWVAHYRYEVVRDDAA